jgi:hypothetical protein
MLKDPAVRRGLAVFFVTLVILSVDLLVGPFVQSGHSF